MGSRHTERIAQVKAELLGRLRQGYHRSGQAFLSNRAVVRRFGISYQTAHRIMAELAEEGWLRRSGGSGTYLQGKVTNWKGIELIFGERARRRGSFGEHLLLLTKSELETREIPHRVRWLGREAPAAPVEGWFPVLWEAGPLAERLAEARCYAVLLGERSLSGAAASFIDAVGVDDYAGGVAAADFFRSLPPGKRIAVVAGPAGDARSRLRTAGFLHRRPSARVVKAGGWFSEHGQAVARRALQFDGVFAVNDRLAAAILAEARATGRRDFRIVGFDDAPVSQAMNFNTIAFPWTEVITTAVAAAQARMNGSILSGSAVSFVPRPVLRQAPA